MTSEKQHFTLYIRDYCMYCSRVLNAVDQLGLDMEVRNIWEDPTYEHELVKATGRRVVPVLAIGEAVEDRTWMAESGDIIRFLEGKSRAI
ncbi:MAG: glutaredoxin family protein [bacterium]